jgi:hypothetical protein
MKASRTSAVAVAVKASFERPNQQSWSLNKHPKGYQERQLLTDSDENIVDVLIELAKSIKHLWKPHSFLFSKEEEFFPSRKQYWIFRTVVSIFLHGRNYNC